MKTYTINFKHVKELLKFLQKDKRKCAKTQVIAILYNKEDTEFAFGTNFCKNPQEICPREEGEGYEKCKSICDQPAHAEINAIKDAVNKNMTVEGSTMIILKHRDMCDNCRQFVTNYGVETVIILNNI